MRKKYDQVFQFKITLMGSKPPIWRKIVVSETYRFWDLHVAIQDAMGWDDCHLHLFTMYSPRTKKTVKIGIPDGNECLKSISEYINDYFSLENPSAVYLYDFGDEWKHKITLEKVFPAKEDEVYPICTGGKYACPPEECGGIISYYDILEVLNDPDSEDYEAIIEWLGADYDPLNFEPEEVIFDDPVERQKLAFS